MKTLFNLSVMLLTLTGFLFVIWYAYPKDALPDVSGLSFEDVVNAHCDGAVGCEITMILNDEGIK